MKQTVIDTGKFYARAIRIALPVMLQLFVQTLVSLVDNFMVAGLGDIKMAGVNVAGCINFIYYIIIGVVCMSGGIFMSQFFGAKDKDGMQQTFRFKIIISIVVGLSYTALTFIAPRRLYNIMVTTNTDAAEIVTQAVLYSKAASLSWIFMALSEMIASSLREIEIVRPPLVISVIATLINTFFNWCFIYGHLGMPRLEAAGAGYATVIARASEFGMFCIYLLIKRPPFLFKLTGIFKIKIKFMVKVFQKSFYILYSELLWAISESISNALYNTRGGADVVSGINAGLNIAHLFFIAFSGIIAATGILLGQELGAKRPEQARLMKRRLLKGSLFFGMFFMIFGLTTTFLVPIVFAKLSSEAQSIAVKLITVSAIYMPLWVYINCQYAISRTGGDTKMGAVCDTVSNVLFVGSLVILCKFTTLTAVALFALVKLSDFAKLAIAHFWLKKERWVRNLTED